MKSQPRSNLLAKRMMIATLPFLGSACSIILASGPPNGHEQMDYFACDEGYIAPVLDLVLGGYLVVLAANLEPPPSLQGEVTDPRIYGLSFSAVWWLSSAIGFRKAKRCEAAKKALAERSRPQSSSVGTPGTPVPKRAGSPHVTLGPQFPSGSCSKAEP